ncbi:MAG: divergent polysaccharide deacetylase family protein [Pseudomonadota bacterium]|nr:divergent polysaccharide deacetylase family protein [Pseudomonadota bacterium]
MGTDLHAPLGQERPAGKRRRLRLSPLFVFSVVSVAAIVGLSAYSMMGEAALKAPEMAAVDVPAETAEAAPATAAPEAAESLRRANPQSGANVERTLTDDGNVVTTYSPRSRAGEGPVIVGTPRIGQDPRLAGTPNEDLLEESPYGQLPVVGEDGLRPMDQYARPWSGARGTRIAIVVGGLGLSQTGTQKAIEDLPAEVTLAFAASGNSLQRWMQVSRRDGHEILIQVPMEPFGAPDANADPATLLTGLPAEENLGRLHEALGKITGYTGIMNYLGGRLLSDPDALEPLLRDVAQRGLLFLDDGTSAQSTSGTLAKAIELPHGFADMTLDAQLEKSAILKKLDDLERLALRKGSAIGVASAFDESVEAIRQWVEEAGNRGIEIVGVSALVEDPADY